MESLRQLMQWFTGGARTPYMTLEHCMSHDYLWIWITVVLDLSVAAGYVVIAMHWYRNQRLLPDVPAKRALSNMRNIFLFCGICGYIFIPIKMVWPAWRLYDLFLAVLVYYTWRYAWNSRELKVVYSELGRTTQLADDVEKYREESRRKSAFLNAISHDLRTPLNALTLQMELAELTNASGDQDETARVLAEIRSTVRSTTGMLDALLDFARIEQGIDGATITTFSLDGLLQEIASRYKASAESKQLFLRVQTAPPVTLHTDRLKLERIVTNLLDNALKFTNNGGVRIEYESAHGGAELHVIDTGPGIEEQHQQRLFDDFYQVHNRERNRVKGFGMGLAIARRLARQLGGDVSLVSAAGGGSRFSLVLPATAVASGKSAVHDADTSAVAGVS
jgi:signal transduction histidine kinase